MAMLETGVASGSEALFLDPPPKKAPFFTFLPNFLSIFLAFYHF